MAASPPGNDTAESLARRADELRNAGRLGDAVQMLDRFLQLRPDNPAAWNNRGNLLLALGRKEDAVWSYDRALTLRAQYPEALQNRAVARIGMGDFREAEAGLLQSLALKPQNPDALFHLGIAVAAQQRHAEALERFDQAIAQGDSSPALYRARAQSLLQLQRDPEALSDFDRVLSQSGGDAELWLGRGIALFRLNRTAEAVTSFDECLRLRPGDTHALYNRANAFALMRQLDEAGRDCEKLLALTPDYPLALGLLLHVRLYSCDWRGLAETRKNVAAGVAAGRQIIHPFLHLAISNLPEEQRRSAEIFAANVRAPAAGPLWRGERYHHDKIRIAYLSADFYAHATAFLMAGVFEQHDGSRFETVAFSYGPNDRSAMRTRLENAFDQFIDVGDAADLTIAQRLRGMEIDIAVDLKGYTGGARPGILACRPAPVQAHYLGYPGTMGSPHLDYIIADRTVIPDEARRFYTEQVVTLPGSYQCNDARRAAATPAPGRSDAGLPDAAFVFCCFNSSFKIMPEMFDVWMRILSRAHGSVLWLLEGNAAVPANLRREAEFRGVSGDRLIFAPHVDVEQHLARLQLADLVLDTLPYGAHTTASDALWSGVPVLTCAGATFAGRVAASLLTALGLQHWIAPSVDEYESRAVGIAADPIRLMELRCEVERQRTASVLFDAAAITRNLEAAYLRMWQRQQDGHPAAAFSV